MLRRLTKTQSRFRPIYYLGVYGYGTSVTTTEERASRLARLDGVETLGYLLGATLAPITLRAKGPNANFLVAILSCFLALIYLILSVDEPLESMF